MSSWYLEQPNGSFITPKGGTGPQAQGQTFTTQANAQAEIPYLARNLGIHATAVSLGAAPSAPADSPGVNSKIADCLPVNTVATLGVKTTGYDTRTTGYSVL